MFGGLEGEESRVESSRVVKRKVEGNYYLSPYLDVFKIKGENNLPFLLFGCFKNKYRNERR